MIVMNSTQLDLLETISQCFYNVNFMVGSLLENHILLAKRIRSKRKTFFVCLKQMKTYSNFVGLSMF